MTDDEHAAWQAMFDRRRDRALAWWASPVEPHPDDPCTCPSFFRQARSCPEHGHNAPADVPIQGQLL